MFRKSVLLIFLVLIALTSCKKKKVNSQVQVEVDGRGGEIRLELKIICPEWCKCMAFFAKGSTADDFFNVNISGSQGSLTYLDDYYILKSGEECVIKRIKTENNTLSSNYDAIEIILASALTKKGDGISSYVCSIEGSQSSTTLPVEKDGSSKINLSATDGTYMIVPSKEKQGEYFASGVDGLNQIANQYYYGKGVKKDISKSIHWFEIASDYGDVDAMLTLAAMYYYGSEEIQRDCIKALGWYEKAARMGSTQAMYNIGTIYVEDKGITVDYLEAYKWWKLAAENGHVKAMYNLGSMYYYGTGVNVDYNKAVDWYRRAYEKGDKNARAKLEEMLRASGKAV